VPFAIVAIPTALAPSPALGDHEMSYARRQRRGDPIVASEKSKDFALVIGLTIPVAMIAFVAAAIYLPRVFSSVDPPRYDFLYMVGSPYGGERYIVIDGKLSRHKEEPPSYTPPGGDWPPQLFVHRVASNTSERISFEGGTALTLDTTPRSPDGFEIVHGRKSEFFFPIVSSTDYRTRYLQKDGWTQKLDLEINSEPGYAGMFILLGWIVEGS
jgi:hypothetical protein